MATSVIKNTNAFSFISMDFVNEQLASTPSGHVSVPSGTETGLVSYTATNDMEGCFNIVGTVVDSNSTGYRYIRAVLKRGTDVMVLYKDVSPAITMSDNYQGITIELPMILKQGDTLGVFATQNSGSSLRFAASINFRGVTHNGT